MKTEQQGVRAEQRDETPEQKLDRLALQMYRRRAWDDLIAEMLALAIVGSIAYGLHCCGVF